ncbi:MAG: hypothetical protein K0B15_05440 [Lentimicrobium sp.]|nr:hypothetical protein [Lentimicrobium sp.]
MNLVIRFTATLLIFVGFASSGLCQNVDSEDAEALTYRLYTQQKWDSLLMTGEKAIAKGYDYFYMRARVGTAAFELQKYSRAITHLTKANEFNDGDEFVLRLLYFSYFYGGRTDEARLFLGTLPAEVAINIHPSSNKPIFYIETGPAFSDHIHQFENKRQGGNGLYSETYLNKNSFYFLAGSLIPIRDRISINTAFSTLNFNKIQRIDNIYGDSIQGDYQVRQFEGYLSPSFLIGKRLKFSPSFRLSNVSYNNPALSWDTSYNDIAFGGEVSYLAPYWTLSAGFWSLEVEKMNYKQAAASLLLRPFGNLNFYTFTTLSFKSAGVSKNVIIHQMLGGRMHNKLWGEAFYTSGDFTGTGELNLQVFYNAYDKIKERYGVRFIYVVSDNLKFTLRGQVYSREGTELFYDQAVKSDYYPFGYQTLSITGGVSWNLQ